MSYIYFRLDADADAAALGKIPELMNQQKLTTRLQVAIYISSVSLITRYIALYIFQDISNNFFFFGQLQKRLALVMQTNESIDG